MNERRMVHAGLLAAAVIAGFGPAAAVRGELIRFTFGGQVVDMTGTPPGPWSGVTVGSPFEFSYVFDSETPDLQPGMPQQGLYMVEELTVTFADAPQTTTEGYIDITNDWWWWDTYEVTAFDLPIGGAAGLQLYGFDVFESDALPTTLDLGLFDVARHFEVGTGTASWEIECFVAMFESEIVPAPGMLALFVLGGLPGAARRRRRG